jgi:Bacterial extracellular solute-binding proteins, family 5 Middle
MLMITITLLSGLVVTIGTHSVAGQVGLTKAYGPAIGSPQPYEPVGPFIDGVLYPQFLSTQDLEWAGLKQGTIDVYDFSMRASQLAEYNNNICITAPDAPAGIAPCGPNLAPIQHEITIFSLNALDKWEIDMESQRFPTSVLAFRQAIAWIVDKENFTANFLGGLGVPIYTTIPAGMSSSWIKPSLSAASCATNHCYGAGLPFATRVATANTILTNAGFTLNAAGIRVNNRPGCASDPGGCGAVLTFPGGTGILFFARSDDPNRSALGVFLNKIMSSAVGSGGLGLAVDFRDVTRSALRTAVFGVNNYNLYTGGWSLTRDPTFIDALYDPLSAFPFGPNYVGYNDPVFTGAARGLNVATSQSNAFQFAFAAEQEYNDSLPVIDVWSTNAPYAYRNYNVDPDPVLNGLRWAGFNVLLGTGWNGGFSFLNAQLIGAPLHDPAHPVFLKYGIKADVLDAPNPITSQFLYDFETYTASYDFLNALANDDLGFTGDLPWAASLPITTNIANGAVFPDGSTCSPDSPATGCSVLTVQLRPDLSFAAALDGSIPAVPVTASDVAFSMLLARDDPGSFISAGYFDLQNVVVTGVHSFQVEFRTQAVWNRHNVGATPILSQQHWCVETHAGTPSAWPGTTNPSVDCRPVSSCVLSGTLFASGIFSCPWPKAPSGCTTCLWPSEGVSVTSSTGGSFTPGPAVGVDLGSYAFVYDSANSFKGPGGVTQPNGPMLFRTRAEGYFTNVGGSTFAINGVQSGWYKFHQAGNVAWYCTTCPSGSSETGPLPAPHMVINIVDLATVAAHFGQSPGLTGFAFGHAAWDLSGSAGTPDGAVNIFDLTRVALHFGQSFLGGADQGGGTEGSIPGWVSETIPGT